jgi:hypothetical protein
MEMNIPKMSTVDIGTNIPGNDLGLRLWEPFQPSEVLYLRSFTYDNKIGRIVQGIGEESANNERDAHISCHTCPCDRRCEGKPHRNDYCWLCIHEF